MTFLRGWWRSFGRHNLDGLGPEEALRIGRSVRVWVRVLVDRNVELDGQAFVDPPGPFLPASHVGGSFPSPVTEP